MLDPVEMNNPSIEAVVEKVKAGPYADLVKSVFGANAFADPKAAMGNLTGALYAYEATERFAPFSSKFDDYLRGKATLTPIEARGFALFNRPQERQLHRLPRRQARIRKTRPTGSSPTSLMTRLARRGIRRSRPTRIRPSSIWAYANAPGSRRSCRTRSSSNSLCGAFKVPTLRNVAVAGAYYHNAAFTSLRDAVAIYATRDTDPKRWYPKLKTGGADKFDDLPSAYKANVNTEEVPYDRRPGQKPRLSDQDVDALVAFLKTLTDKGMQ